MILGKDDINAIADEVLRRLLPILAPLKTDKAPCKAETSAEYWARHELEVMALRKQRAEGDQMDVKIREISPKIPAEFRPLPEQYRSHDRKILVLELIEDPARWPLIPQLPKQWPNRKRTQWEDGIGPSPFGISERERLARGWPP